jgi:hypothetical protein
MAINVTAIAPMPVREPKPKKVVPEPPSAFWFRPDKGEVSEQGYVVCAGDPESRDVASTVAEVLHASGSGQGIEVPGIGERIIGRKKTAAAGCKFRVVGEPVYQCGQWWLPVVENPTAAPAFVVMGDVVVERGKLPEKDRP